MRVMSWLDSSRRRRVQKSLKHLDSDDSATSSSLSEVTGSSSLHSSLSLQTLPSVPSLQKIPSDAHAITVSHSVTSSFKLRERSLPVTCLAVNGDSVCQLLVRGRRERCPKPLVNYWGMVLIPIGGESFDLSGFVIRDGGSLDGFSPARSLWFRRRECEKLCCV
ncbi:hypothetical protein F2Q69_00054173 [Brassica cretica]|uniref:Uncharacterized protein n=1 Tax=Brassica cretica TaxID=69181 RepID=A0A8S9MNC2_BRACR|nr:hypothetical protein F2Q69_00054173 [Brassica cretica]